MNKKDLEMAAEAIIELIGYVDGVSSEKDIDRLWDLSEKLSAEAEGINQED